MNLDFLNLALSQITHLVTNLTKKNYSLYVQQIRELIREYGFEADRHYLRCLFSYFEVGATHKESLQLQLLSEECSALLTKPALVSSICFSFDKTVNSKLFVNLQGAKPSNQLLLQFSKALKLSPIQEVVFAIALLDSSVPDTVSQATQFLKIKLPDLINSYVDSDCNGTSTEGGLSDTTPEVLHLILRHVFSVIPDQLGIPQKTKEAFLKNLRRDFPRDLVPTVLAPLLYQDNTDLSFDKLVLNLDSMSHNLVEGSMEEMVGDIGSDLTRSVESCKGCLTQICGRDPKPADMASILVLMLKSRAFEYWLETEGKKDIQDPSNPALPWNIETLVQAVKEINMKFNWSEVLLELDQPEFIVKDKFGLHLVILTIRLGLQSQGFYQDRFPVDHIYRHWKHTEPQLNLIAQILKNPEIFCFADYRYLPVAVDILKAPPETDNKDIASWHSLQLIEAILYLAERGHHYSQVQEILKVPAVHCPDVLALGILQSCQQTNMTAVRQEILATLMPVFLSNHPNSAVILQHAWHSQHLSIRQVIIHSMAEWYMRGDSDQSRLSRLLDVAQDLKALTFLLNSQTFPFVIDLACLASRRGYLKLEKWLSDKIREHDEPFITALIKFLQKRVPHIVSGLVKEDSIPKAAQLPHETLSTILICLQSCVSNVSQELAETIHGVVATCGIVVSKTAGRGGGGTVAPPVLRSHRSAIDTFTPSSVFSSQVDSINSGIASISLGATTSSAFTLPAGGGVIGNLGPLVSQPGSPSRLMAASQSPAFPMMPLGPPPIVPVPPSAVAARLLTNQSQQPQQAPNDKNRFTIFPKDIDDEANSYFQRIYNHPPHPTLSIDEVLDMLKKFMDSPKQRERDVFYCMLRNLFEEYKFFPQYPEKELLITAQLFGGIIERGLVADYRELGMALRCVLDALRKPLESKMFYFGMTALDRFKTRLKDYQKYCEHIANIPNFSSFPQHLVDCVEYGLQGGEPPARSQNTSILPPGITAATVVTTAYKTVTQTTVTTTTSIAMTKSTPIISSRPSIANATNIDTLLTATEKEDKMTEPPSSIQDKVGFIFNNLSQLNLQTKCDELKDIMSEEYWAWMAQYLVMKRASIELNFHGLYSNFLEVVKIPELNRLVLRETFRNIRVLLRSDKGIENFSDRSLLKNLGHWLGMLTLGKNRPILQKDLNLKALLVEAYNKGQQELLYVVPFIAKVLESCAKSKAFKPPNPWTMGIMSVLAELLQEQDLKLNLKFEIEVLCKNLTVDVAELKPVIYLKDPENIKIVEHQLSPPKPVRTEVVQSTTPVALACPPQPQPQPHPVVTHTPDESRVSNSTPTLTALNPPEPRFSYLALSVSNTASIANLITINSQLQLFQTHPQLKQYVWPAVERAIQEWISPVVDRSVKIAVTATEQIIKKEFALEPDESKMRVAAHHMVRNLTAGMAMITCREQLILSIGNNLKGSFLSSLHSPNEQQKSLIEHAATVCAQENMELACAYIQKTAIEKAVPEMDKHLQTEYERRKHARSEGRRYCDSNVLTYQAERMPELIRLKVGGVSPQQMVVYEDFARNIPGFQPLSDRDAALFLPKPVSYPVGSGDEMDTMFEKLQTDLEHYQQTVLNSQVLPQVHGLMDLLAITRKNRDSVSAISVIQKTIECKFELSNHVANSTLDAETILRHREMYIRILKTFQDHRMYGAQFTNKHIIRAMTDSREDYRCNLEVVDTLLRSGVLSMSQLDINLAQTMENGQNFMAVNFAMQVVQSYLIDARNPVSDIDLYNTIDVLVRITNHTRQPPEGLTTLIDLLRVNHSEQSFLMDRAPGGATAHIHSGIHTVRSREYEDPPALVEKTEFLLREWVTIYHSPQGSKEPNRAFTIFVHQLHNHGILKSDDLITRFFRLSMQMVVELCYRYLPDANAPGNATNSVRSKIFHTLDAYTKLIALLVKHSGDVSNTGLKINLLNKVMGIMAGVLQQDHEQHQTDFQQLPYHRAFIMLFLELNTPDPVLESINYQVLTAYCHTLHILRPAKSPGFSYAWLELISHRMFLGRMLASHQQKCWGYYAQLLIDLFKYLAPFLRNAELAKPVTVIYKGTLRVLLVLLHDFPEFLCEYHYGFCDVIPPNCIQMRNLILSAFPRNMRLPDPFTPNLKVDMLPEISQGPRVLTNYTTTIQPSTFKKELDTYLKARAPVTFLSELRSNLQVSQEPGLRYNIQLMNALVLYVGTQAIAYIRNKGLAPNMSTIAHSAHMDIFQNLAVDLDTEGRYLFLNAIANQLRYPNSHTHYFSCTLLYLFAEANTEAIQEQITRVLLERLIVNRPHPWGLLITFIELIKNPTYKFWNHEFVHCAPEIEKLFESVARSCMVQKHIAPSTENDIAELHNMTNQTTFTVA